MPDNKPSIQERFRRTVSNLSHEECMAVLPLARAWVEKKTEEYANEGAAPAGRPAMRIGNKSY